MPLLRPCALSRVACLCTISSTRMNSHEHHLKKGAALLKEPVQPEWVDYPTAERFSSLSHTTLWRYVSSGEIKAAKVGRSVHIHLPSMKEFRERRDDEQGFSGKENREPNTIKRSRT